MDIRRPRDANQNHNKPHVGDDGGGATYEESVMKESREKRKNRLTPKNS